MSSANPSAVEISPQQITERRDDTEFVVLDIRNAESHENWAVNGSYNLAICDDLRYHDFKSLEESLGEVPSNMEIAVICDTGNTSAIATGFLRDRGYEARSVTGGMRGWGRVHPTHTVDSVTGVYRIVRPATGCVSYLVFDRGEAIVVDPSQYVEQYRRCANKLGVEIKGVIDTHIHADHISGGRVFAKKFDTPYYLHENNIGSVEECHSLEDEDLLPVGSRDVEVIHSSGHTPGSISLRFGEGLLSGDTLFLRGVGRPDLEDSTNEKVREAALELYSSLVHLRTLPETTVVLPGHFSSDEHRPRGITLGHLTAENELFEMIADGDKSMFLESILETPNNYQRIKYINRNGEPLTGNTELLELGPNNCAAN